jgi:hypothetical protein
MYVFLGNANALSIGGPMNARYFYLLYSPLVKLSHPRSLPPTMLLV